MICETAPEGDIIISVQCDVYDHFIYVIVWHQQLKVLYIMRRYEPYIDGYKKRLEKRIKMK